MTAQVGVIVLIFLISVAVLAWCLVLLRRAFSLQAEAVAKLAACDEILRHAWFQLTEEERIALRASHPEIAAWVEVH